MGHAYQKVLTTGNLDLLTISHLDARVISESEPYLDIIRRPVVLDFQDAVFLLRPAKRSGRNIASIERLVAIVVKYLLGPIASAKFNTHKEAVA